MEEDDVILEVEGVSIVLKKTELMNASPYFEVMFSGDFIEKNKRRIELKDVKLRSFLSVLDALKRKTPNINYADLDDLIQILTTANMLQFTNVQNNCVNALNALLSLDNVLLLWQTAEIFSLKTLHVKSLYLALTEFEKVRKTDGFLNLDCKWLFRFLANRNLMADHEMNVFQAGMEWFAKNEKSIVDTENFVYTLLTCLNFNELTEFNIHLIISQMQNHASLKDLKCLIDVLQYIHDVRIKVCSQYSNDVIDKARLLIESKRRLTDGQPSFLLRYKKTEHDDTVRKLGLDTEKLEMHQVVLFYYDGTDFKLFASPSKNVFLSVDGQAVFGYKHFIVHCGGEHVIGRETWLRNVQLYDVLTGESFVKAQMPYLRRHFKVIVCGKVVYFVGGYGQYRTNQGDNMFWYDCEANCWSSSVVLPDRKGEQIMCCNYNQQLFLMVVSAVQEPRGYLCLREKYRWKKIVLRPDAVDPIETGKCTMFAYRNHIFVKGKFLTEYQLFSNELLQLSKCAIDSHWEEDGVIVDYCVCNDTVYTLYERPFEETKILESFSMITHCAKRTPVVADRLFPFRHYNTCESEEYVCDYFKSAAC